MIAVDLDEGKLYDDREIKDMLAGTHAYGEWIDAHRRARRADQAGRAARAALFAARRAAPPPGRRRLIDRGPRADPRIRWSRTARKPSARWATTRRSRCCRTRYRGRCSISSARTSARSPTRRSTPCARRSVMSLKTRFGNLGNILDAGRDAEPRCCRWRARCCSTPSSRRCAGYMGDTRRRDRLHLRRRGRRSTRCAQAHRPHPQRGRGRGARRAACTSS